MVCDENASKWNAPKWNRAKVGHVKLGHVKLARAKLNAPNWHDTMYIDITDGSCHLCTSDTKNLHFLMSTAEK